MSTLRLSINAIAFGDPDSTAQPRLRHFDWLRAQSVVDAANPRSETYTLAPGESRTIFSGVRALALDGTTEMEVSMVAGTTMDYRLSHTGVGTAPGFRTSRSLDLTGQTVTVTVNSNETATFATTGGAFAGAVVGDVLWIPGSVDGVTSPFSVANQGQWLILSASSGSIVARRAEDFNAEAQVVSVTDVDHVVVFSAAGVQVGDKIEVISGFGSANRGTFPIVEVTDRFVTVRSVLPMVDETLLPGAGSVVIHSNAKRWMRIESDQEVAVRCNGDATNLTRIVPWVAGDSAMSGDYSRTGPTYSLTIVNLSLSSAQVSLVSIE